MSDTFYSVVLGDQAPNEVTVGTSTSSEAIELRVLDGTGITKVQLLKGLEAIENYIKVNSAPA